MQIEVGYGHEMYGTMTLQAGQIVCAGPQVEHVRDLLATSYDPETDPAAYLAALPAKLRYFLWARPVVGVPDPPRS